jgi:DNA polymerase-3 subunit alpha/error-prone DNA polymerase
MRLLTVGPDVNVSRWKYYGKGREVVIGLMAIKGISATGAKALLEERKRGGDFISLDDFSRRVKLGRDDIIALCPAGVFDSIAEGLPRTMQARRLLGTIAGGVRKGQDELFAAEASPMAGVTMNTVIAPTKKAVAKNDNDLWEEYRAMGFLRNVHPLALWKDDVVAVKYRVKAYRIGENVGRFVKMVGWPVTQKEVWTKDGLTMSFLTFEDETAIYETVIFPQIYEKYNRLLFDQRPLLVYGRVMDDEGAMSLEVSKIEVLGARAMGQDTYALRYADYVN